MYVPPDLLFSDLLLTQIVSLVDAELVEESPYAGLYCFQELMEWDLANVIFSPVQFSEFHIRSFIHQILSGLKYAHLAEVIHRDLKPGNILVTWAGILKICDFGLSRAIGGFLDGHPKKEGPSATPITNYVATRWYRAPELLMRERHYGKPVDMWAVGCILAELYGRKPLMPGKDSIHQFHEMVKYLGAPAPQLILRHRWNIPAMPSLPAVGGGGTTEKSGKDLPNSEKVVTWESLFPFASLQGLAFLDKLLRWDPADRFTVNEALGHEYLAKVGTGGPEPRAPGIFQPGPEEHETSIEKLNLYLKEQVELFRQARWM